MIISFLVSKVESATIYKGAGFIFLLKIEKNLLLAPIETGISQVSELNFNTILFKPSTPIGIYSYTILQESRVHAF